MKKSLAALAVLAMMSIGCSPAYAQPVDVGKPAATEQTRVQAEFKAMSDSAAVATGLRVNAATDASTFSLIAPADKPGLAKPANKIQHRAAVVRNAVNAPEPWTWMLPAWT